MQFSKYKLNMLYYKEYINIKVQNRCVFKGEKYEQ